ncbi:hypothetical protein F1645_16380 (plasmid) [Novacetimonas hansenii]|uniref:Uncharacterized protein n=1 Tax=Novacetimonas hansenii TaxID=436 RepID=A0ABQ0SFZ9_NOVHA|nr:hypothetical protein [Novacetimonas hansenii]GAN83786.1 hypothetical protein Gaha_0105_021 [Novacetimonas hansenii JCM 7643]GBQ63044.1 hypothetical protein AA0243_3020 [Novacetimonas hansenii NRIC 0243]GEC64191.1 hypothetical protein GHA01_20400 [Novacetimonas hansenii]
MSIPKKLPSLPSTQPSSAEAEAFIGGAPNKEIYPWEHQDVRSDLLVSMSTRVPEKLMLQMEWLLSKSAGRRLHARQYKQTFVIAAVEAYVHKELTKRGVPSDRQ